MLTNPYLVAALILAWACSVAVIIAFFMGRDRLIHDNRPLLGEKDPS